jgi:AI-2 transport protein TqsA
VVLDARDYSLKTVSFSQPNESKVNDEESRGKIQTICLMILATAVLVYFVFWLRPVLLPFVVAVFVVSGISPVLNWLQQLLGVGRLVAAGVTFMAGLLMMTGLGIAMWFSAVQLANNSDIYRDRVNDIVARMDDWIPNKSSQDRPPAGVQANSLQGTPTASQIEKVKKDPATEWIDSMVREGISGTTQGLFGLVSTSVVVMIYVFFLLLGTAGNQKILGTWQDIDSQIRSYIALKTVISFFTGLAFGLSLFMFGVPMPLTFGVLAFLLNFIPNVGPLVASLLPVPLIVLAPDGSLEWMIGAIAVSSLVQVVSGNIVEPKLMGESSDLHPVTVLLALMFWGMMWGIVGMFLATPITSGIKILLTKIPSTRPIAEVMAGRWNTPANVESPA